MVSKGDLSLAYKIFERFIQRVDERVAVAHGTAQREISTFTTDESIVIDADSTLNTQPPPPWLAIDGVDRSSTRCWT